MRKPFARGLSAAFLALFTEGPGAPMVRACHERGLDLRLRDEEVHIYDLGRRVVGIAGSPPRLNLHEAYVPRGFLEHRRQIKGSYVWFDFDAVTVEAWLEALQSIRRRSAAHAGDEESVELKFLQQNRGASPLRCLDRQVQVPGQLGRCDVAAVLTDRKPARFVMAELKRFPDPSIQRVFTQLSGYLEIVDPGGEGLREDVAQAYALVASQLRTLGFAAPAPELIQPGMKVLGLAVIAAWNPRSKLLDRAFAGANTTPPHQRLYYWLPDHSLEVPRATRWKPARSRR